MEDLLTAKRILETGVSCVLCKESLVFTSRKKGVLPLLEFLDSKVDFSAFSSADKVVGKGAAMIYLKLGIKKIYAEVISDVAYDLLIKNDVIVKYSNKVERIKNRDNTGFCPIEDTVFEIDDIDFGIKEIRRKIDELNS